MDTRKCVVVFTTKSDLDEQLITQFDASDYRVVTCQSSEELHRLSKNSRIDCAIISQQLPGFLTGLDIVSRLSEELVQPVLILIGTLKAEEKATAQALHVASILPVTAPAQTIAMSAKQLLLSAIHTGISIPYGARDLVRNANCIRPLPQLIVRLAGSLDSPNTSIHTIADEISADAKVTADLLRLINSSSIGIATKVSKIEDILRLLGVKRTISIVLSSYLLGSSHQAAFRVPEELERHLRLRAVLEAASAKSYAVMQGHQSPDLAYVLGLLQDIGILVLAHELGNSYQQSLKRCQSVPQLTLWRYENQQLGFTHADVSAALLQKWELPPAIIRLVLEHHSSSYGKISEADRQLATGMKLAEALADAKENPAPQRFLTFRKLAVQMAKFDDTALRSYISQSAALASEISDLFSVPVPSADELQRLAESLISQEETAMTADCPATYEPEVEQPRVAEPIDQPIIVVLDDDDQVLNVIRLVMSRSGFNVQCGKALEDVREAIDRACIILLDVHLGDVFGPGLLNTLRRRGLNTPVIMLSGDCRRTSVAASIAAGACDYLPKPFTKDSLLNKVYQHMSVGAQATCPS